MESLKTEILTKDAILALQNDELRGSEIINTVEKQIEIEAGEEITVEAEIVKCKKCKFSAPNLQFLGLHIENNHQGNQFECSECSSKFSFKNQLKLHRRQEHEERTFACFVCNNKFKTHQDLKRHIQKKCKDNRQSNQLTVAVTEEIALDDRFKCSMCDKVTNNQVSLLSRMQQKHQRARMYYLKTNVMCAMLNWSPGNYS